VEGVVGHREAVPVCINRRLGGEENFRRLRCWSEEGWPYMSGRADSVKEGSSKYTQTAENNRGYHGGQPFGVGDSIVKTPGKVRSERSQGIEPKEKTKPGAVRGIRVGEQGKILSEKIIRPPTRTGDSQKVV